MALVVRMSVAEHIDCFLDGFCQAFCWSRAATLIHSQVDLMLVSTWPSYTGFHRSHAVQRSLVKTILLNGVIFLGILFFIDSFYNTPEHTLFGYSYTVSFLCVGEGSWFDDPLYSFPTNRHWQVIQCICYVLWPMPVSFQGLQRKHFVCMVASISDTTTVNQYQHLPPSAWEYYTWAVLHLSDVYESFHLSAHHYPFTSTAYSWLIIASSMCPNIQFNFKSSYCCHRYKWMHMGWSLEHRLAHVEKHWAFFFGFGKVITHLSFVLGSITHYHYTTGLPATLLTFFLSTLHAGAVFALIFPSVGVICTNERAAANNNDSMSSWQLWALWNPVLHLMYRSHCYKNGICQTGYQCFGLLEK